MSARMKARAKPSAPAWPGPTIAPDCKVIPLTRIVPDPDQPRKHFDESGLAELAGSLVSLGQLQPIAVRRGEGDAYLLIAGERRWRAARRAGLEALTAVVVEGPALETAKLRQLAENVSREDLSPLDEARAYRAELDRTGLSTHALAEAVGTNHSRIVRKLALLKLPAEVQALVASGELADSTAYGLLKLPDEWDQIDVARLAVAGGWTRAAVATEVARRTAPPPPPAHSTPPESPPEVVHGEPPEETSGPIETPKPDAPATEDGAATTAEGVTPGTSAGPRNGQAGAPGKIREPVLVDRRSLQTADGTGFTTPEILRDSIADPHQAAEIDELRAALEESVKLQSHYAGLLNEYDGGFRRQFATADEWIQRLRECKASKEG